MIAPPLRHRLELLAGRMPPDMRGPFLRAAVERIGQVAFENRQALTFGTLGWVVGRTVDGLMTVWIPGYGTICLTGGNLATVGGLAGLVTGFLEDRAEARQRRMVEAMIVEVFAEFQRRMPRTGP